MVVLAFTHSAFLSAQNLTILSRKPDFISKTLSNKFWTILECHLGILYHNQYHDQPGKVYNYTISHQYHDQLGKNCNYSRKQRGTNGGSLEGQVSRSSYGELPGRRNKHQDSALGPMVLEKPLETKVVVVQLVKKICYFFIYLKSQFVAQLAECLPRIREGPCLTFCTAHSRCGGPVL